MREGKEKERGYREREAVECVSKLVSKWNMLIKSVVMEVALIWRRGIKRGSFDLESRAPGGLCSHHTHTHTDTHTHTQTHTQRHTQTHTQTHTHTPQSQGSWERGWQ